MLHAIKSNFLAAAVKVKVCYIDELDAEGALLKKIMIEDPKPGKKDFSRDFRSWPTGTSWSASLQLEPQA